MKGHLEVIEGHRILVTGGAGFIGSHLCDRLVHGNEVVVFDNGHRDALRHSPCADHPRLTRIIGDVLKPEQVGSAIAGCDMVIHMAAIAGIDTVVTRPMQTMQVNLFGALNVLEAAARIANVRRVVLFSTSEVYGPHVFRGTEDSPTTQGSVGEPRWTYAVSKLASEHLGFAYRDATGLPITAIRPFNVYGPRQVGESAIRKFCMNAVAGQPLRITGDGTQIRAWCYVDDFVDGLLAALQREEAVGEVINLGNPKETMTVLALAETIIRVTNSVSTIVFVEQPMADVEVRVPSIDKARRLLDFCPKVTLASGLQRTIAWLQNVGI